ncbi:MAG TPA: tRNA uridine-5-carboxymethylaminomethyl(34) synthesis GTPase MnmE [Chitinophagaceae bacterium]|nr:MAG: tRNA modification GTPase TrmE [Bacteroidetes bacterium OLB11]HMN31900.1 tRNA uridine-5-carboxymethylaminomethyl(34) synthesis GTPase MnmE [Chitinophagaceae bacterium]
MNNSNHQQQTIVSLSSSPGHGAIAVIRLSGSKAFEITSCFFSKKNITEAPSHTLHYGKILDSEKQLIDEVVLAIFKSPNSFTGEDTVEISCHGSPYIIEKIIELCLSNGAVLAKAGEFTQRAFLNGKMDLSQAEAVADIIASENESQHRIAFQQMRGNYSQKIEELRQELIDFAALIELELDFSEEDVEFADREKFLSLIEKALINIKELIQSFQLGNAIKKGIPIAIVGKPNVGKSTLLNALLQEEKAIVSSIAGTTRDFIEDTMNIKGVLYRFIDTAGIRNAKDEIEAMGIKRSFEKMKQADLILYLCDIHEDYQSIVSDFHKMSFDKNQKVIIVLNKSDKDSNLCNAYDIEEAVSTLTQRACIEMSAKEKRNIEKLIHLIEKTMQIEINQNNMIVSNTRHLEAFKTAEKNLILVQKGITSKLSGEFISIDMRAALQALGSITNQISNEDILSSVFSRFCIGK